MHHGAQGRLCFLKNSGDPDDFLFLLRLHYAPLQWYMGYLCTICNMHHQATMCTMVHKGDYIFFKIQGFVLWASVHGVDVERTNKRIDKSKL